MKAKVEVEKKKINDKLKVKVAEATKKAAVKAAPVKDDKKATPEKDEKKATPAKDDDKKATPAKKDDKKALTVTVKKSDPICPSVGCESEQRENEKKNQNCNLA